VSPRIPIFCNDIRSSWYSSAEIHICKKVRYSNVSEKRTDSPSWTPQASQNRAPIQVEYFRSGGAYILILNLLMPASWLRSKDGHQTWDALYISKTHHGCGMRLTSTKCAPTAEDDIREETFRRSRSTRLMIDNNLMHTASSCPIISGWTRFWARNRSGPATTLWVSNCDKEVCVYTYLYNIAVRQSNSSFRPKASFSSFAGFKAT